MSDDGSDIMKRLALDPQTPLQTLVFGAALVIPELQAEIARLRQELWSVRAEKEQSE